jgi:hypothetical protein
VATNSKECYLLDLSCVGGVGQLIHPGSEFWETKATEDGSNPHFHPFETTFQTNFNDRNLFECFARTHSTVGSF